VWGSFVDVHTLVVQHRFKDKCFMTFEPLTLVPLQTKLIVKDLLTTEEVCLSFCAVFFKINIKHGVYGAFAYSLY